MVLFSFFLYTVFDLISEHALISGHPPFFIILILIIISSDFREGNTRLLYTGLMATRALTLRVHLLGQNLKKANIKKKLGGPNKFVKRTPLIRSNTVCYISLDHPY